MKNAKRLTLIFAGILIGVALVVFVIENQDQVKLRFLMYETMPLWQSLIVLASIVLGALFTSFFTFITILKHKSRIRKLKKHIKTLDDELLAYRNMSLCESDLPYEDEEERALANDTKETDEDI